MRPHAREDPESVRRCRATDPQLLVPDCGCYPALVGFISMKTDSTTPISASWMDSAVPP